MAKEYYIDEKVNSDNFKAVYTINSLYDDKYAQSLKTPALASPRNLYTLYNNPSDVTPFTSTLQKGKTDLSIRYFSNNELYNRDGRYRLNDDGELADRAGDGNYVVNLNSFNNSSFTSMLSENVRGAINPSAGSPIRLRAPEGFHGYIQCLTKNNNYTVALASAPSDISNNRQVNTASDTAIGRAQGFNFFSDVSSRQVSFSFEVYADYLPAPYSDVLSYCKALEQMNLPTYSSNFINSPVVRFEYGGFHIIGIPTITCTFGNTIKKGIIDKATVSVNIIETEEIVGGKVIL